MAEVIAHPTLAPEAQRLLREWSQKGIAIAQTKIHQGRLEAGIAIAQRIPLESPLYPDAQAAIAIWEAEWQAGTKIIHQFNTALDAQAWERATQLFLALAEFDSDYWRITRADELMFQLSQAKTAKQRQEDVASFLTAELSPQQERLISVLVEIKQPQTARRVATAGWESAILDLMQGLWDKQQFGALQQVAKVIQPDSEIYVEAQDWLLLVQATELAAQGTVQSLADAIALLDPLTEQSQVSPLAQQQQSQWEATRQTLQAQADNSQPLPFIQVPHPSQTPAETEKVAVESHQPQLNAEAQQEAQQSLRRKTQAQQLQNSRAILQAATQLANQQQYTAAIEKAQEIPPDQLLYEQARIAIATWKAKQ